MVSPLLPLREIAKEKQGNDCFAFLTAVPTVPALPLALTACPSPPHLLSYSSSQAFSS